MCDMKCLQYSRSPPPSIQWVTPLQPTNLTKAFIRTTIVRGGGSLLKIKELGRTFVSYFFPELNASFIWGRRRRTSSIRSQEEGIVLFLCCIGNRLERKGKRNLNGTTLHSPPFFAGKLSSFFVYAGRKDSGNILAIRSRGKNSPNHKNARFCSEK